MIARIKTKGIAMNPLTIIPLVIFLGFAQQQSSAKIVAWNENIPSSLKPFQNNVQTLANLTQDNILIYAQIPQKTSIPTLKTNSAPTVKFTSSAILIPANTQEVQKLLLDYQHYVGLFPTLKTAKITKQTANISQVKYKVSIPTPIPILNFNENVTIQHQLGQNSLASLVIDAPIPYAVGKFEWFRVNDQKTLLTLTQWGDLNQPKGFIFSKILNAIPEVKLGIPSGSNAFILESIKRKFSNNKVNNLQPGQFPVLALNAEQLEKILELSRTTSHPVSFVLPQTSLPYTHGREKMRFSTTYQYFPQSNQQLQKWLKPSSYQSIFPRQIKKVTLSDVNTQEQDAAFKVSIGLGVLNIPFDFQMHFNYPNANENIFYANGGDLKYLKGQTQLIPNNTGTLLKMTSAVKIDEKAPFLLRSMRSLPYHDMLPALGANAVFVQKIQKLK